MVSNTPVPNDMSTSSASCRSDFVVCAVLHLHVVSSFPCGVCFAVEIGVRDSCHLCYAGAARQDVTSKRRHDSVAAWCSVQQTAGLGAV